MDFSTQDYLKKALLDTQERVRDFTNYADTVEDKRLRSYFKEYAKSEGRHAQELSEFLQQ